MSLRVLTICLGNHCRSPMAAGLLRDLATRRGFDWTVESAGTSGLVGVRAAAHAVTAMREVGVDIADHRGAQLTRAQVDAADHVLIMDPDHGEDVLELAPDARGKLVLLDPNAVPDPMGQDLAAFRGVRDLLARRITAWADGLGRP